MSENTNKQVCSQCNKEYTRKSYYLKHIEICGKPKEKKIKTIVSDIIKSDSDECIIEKRPPKRKLIKKDTIAEKSIKDIDNSIEGNSNQTSVLKKKSSKKKQEYHLENSNVSLQDAHLKPIIKWSGGKSDEIKYFEKYIPSDFKTYLEPFVGGGSVFFYLFPNSAVINDVHPELIDFYTNVKNGNSKEIYKFMEEHPNDENTYYDVRDKMLVNNSLDNAKRFYYLRKTCFRGMLRYNSKGKFNIPYGKYKTINYEDLNNPNYQTIFENTSILNNSFEHIFENYNSYDNFMFLDPPYDSEFTDYGYCSFGKDEHRTLANLFKTTKIKCLMVIGKTDFIVELYKDYIVEEFDKKYRFKIHSGRVGDEINTKHLIIKNYKS